MKTSNELLQGILTTVARIDSRMARDSKKSTGAKGSTGIISGRIKKATTGRKNKKTSAAAAFISDLMSAHNFDDKKIGVISTNIHTISMSLPDLVEGVKELQTLNTRKAKRGINVLNLLFASFEKLGRPITSRNVSRSIRTLTRMGRALMRVAKPLNKMSNFLLKLSLGIVAFAGSLFLASKILKISGSPLMILGVIALTVVAMVGAFILLGMAKRAVKRGAKTIGFMGVALTLLSLGILAFSITLVATAAILGAGGGIGGVLQALGMIGLIVAGTAGMFWLIGKLALNIALGTLVSLLMTVGMVALSFGIMAIATAAKGISMMANGDKKSTDEVTQGDKDKMSIIGGLGTMGLILLGAIGLFALLGIPVVAGLIALGSVTAILMSVSLIALAYSISHLLKISEKFKGTDVSGTISNLISGVFIGFTEGISGGLMGKTTKDPTWWQKAGNMAKNTALLISGIALISGVSISLSLFALSLRAFQKVGTIVPIIGGTKENPKFGAAVSVLDVSKNIAYSISSFFTTLNDLFGENGGMPKPSDIKKITNMLLGSSGLRVFGFDIARTKPNLMDALMKFGSTLKFWSQFGENIPIGTDPDGNPIKGPKVSTVAKNIGEALSGFMRNMVGVFDKNGRMPTTSEIGKIVNILTGESGLKLFGINVSGGPNLMDALMKFGNTLKFWGQFGEAGEIPMGTDAKGDPINGVPLTKVASNIAKAVGGFMTSLTTEIPKIGKKLQPRIAQMARILLGEKSTGYLGMAKWLIGIPDAPGILEPVSKFADVIQQFAAGQIQTGEYDANGNPIWKPIDYPQTAKNVVSAISGFATELAKGLSTLSGEGSYGSKAEDAANYIGKFESMFDKLEKLSSATTGLDKLAASLGSVGSGIGEIADNLERMDVEKLDATIMSIGRYQVQTKDVPSPAAAPTGANASLGAQKEGSIASVDWDNVSALIGVTVGQEVSNALKRGQFKFEFDTTKTGGTYYWDPH